MTSSTNKLTVLLAFLMLSSRGSAQEKTDFYDPKVFWAVYEIKHVSENDPRLLHQNLLMQKSQMENELKMELTDEEFTMIQAVIGQLLSEGVDIQAVPSDKMILSSQEVYGGG